MAEASLPFSIGAQHLSQKIFGLLFGVQRKLALHPHCFVVIGASGVDTLPAAPQVCSEYKRIFLHASLNSAALMSILDSAVDNICLQRLSLSQAVGGIPVDAGFLRRRPGAIFPIRSQVAFELR